MPRRCVRRSAVPVDQSLRMSDGMNGGAALSAVTVLGEADVMSSEDRTGRTE